MTPYHQDRTKNPPAVQKQLNVLEGSNTNEKNNKGTNEIQPLAW
ncbi:hypothetical protein JOC77_000922 [Peribacillus deserti]|uniref:YpzG family protein n=1 Tax=Peribacillus deserti TaxID=673318 RepID=A0ABS2QEC6_9BACI|nr:hypothetical protein [Peribacillus deserti]MBM7691517.1 hypothetical protein [Peribacillus deserti]